MSRRSGVGLAAGQSQDANIAEIAIALGIVQAIADHEFVGNFETDVVRPDFFHAPPRFAEQGGHVQGARVALRDHTLEIVDGATGVQDVFHQDRVQALDVVIQVLGKANLTGTVGGLAVTRHGDEIQ